MSKPLAGAARCGITPSVDLWGESRPTVNTPLKAK